MKKNKMRMGQSSSVLPPIMAALLVAAAQCASTGLGQTTFTWTASPSPGVTGYALFHGTTSGQYYELADARILKILTALQDLATDLLAARTSF